MALKSIISIAIISLVVVFALWYLVTHIWYLLVPNIEAFTVEGAASTLQYNSRRLSTK